MRQQFILALSVFFISCTVGGDKEADSGDQTWNSDLRVENIVSVEIEGVSYSSSSTMKASWIDLPESYGSVQLEVTDQSTGLNWTVRPDNGRTELVLHQLKSATEYTLSIRACADDDCGQFMEGGSASAKTAEEVWQLQGSGSDIDSLVNIVSDSNAKAHAFVHGEDSDLSGRVQLYYGAMGGYGGSLSAATSNRQADASDLSVYSDFTSHVGSSGIIEPESSSTLVEWIGTGQGVPLKQDIGGGVRLFFEARGADGATRIMSLDSQDGDFGLDFNAGQGDYCSLASDYMEGGGCHPKVVIGVQDDDSDFSMLDNARQMKVGVSTLTDWRWGEEAGTFMVFTTGAVDGCSESEKNHGYAIYDGDSWVVQRDESNCPKLFKAVQAMVPLQLAQGRFKIQFGNPEETDGALGGNLPFLGPKRIIYGDSMRTGDPSKLEFEDWDSVEDAREITFLWPDGTVLDDTAEGYIDDFVVLTPTFDVSNQIQFVVLTDGQQSPFTSLAVLKNF